MRINTTSLRWSLFLVAITMVYSMPLKAVKFYSYTNDQGETVFSNVPRDCVSDSVMTCMDYHPVTRRSLPETRPTPSPERSKRLPEKSPNASGSRNSPAFRQQAVNDSLLGVLENLSDMNAIIDQYFPGNADPVEAAKVRERQEKILEVLEVLKRGAGDDERPTINRAIGILRDNLVD